MRRFLDTRVGRVNVFRAVEDDTFLFEEDKGFNPEHVYVRYAVARGICGLLGPHEAPEKKDVLKYDYPRADMSGAEHHLHNVDDAEVPEVVAIRLEAEDARIYAQKLAGVPKEASGIGLYTEDAAETVLSPQKESGAAVNASVRGYEPARECRWAPMWEEVVGIHSYADVSYSTLSIALCKAVAMEILDLRLGAILNAPPNQSTLKHSTKVTLRAMRAVAKLRQLASMAVVARTAPSNAPNPSGFGAPTPPPQKGPKLEQ